jgi:hypothetical protein
MCNCDKVLDNQIVTFNLIGNLAYKLTGQIPTIPLNLDNGEVIMITPTIANSVWGEGASGSAGQNLRAFANAR